MWHKDSPCNETFHVSKSLSKHYSFIGSRTKYFIQNYRPHSERLKVIANTMAGHQAKFKLLARLFDLVGDGVGVDAVTVAIPVRMTLDGAPVLLVSI
jgi:hypothetical protein